MTDHTEAHKHLAERVSLAIADAVNVGGLSVEQAASAVAAVAADYTRVHVGESYLAELAAVVRDRAARFPRGADEPDLFEGKDV